MVVKKFLIYKQVNEHKAIYLNKINKYLFMTIFNRKFKFQMKYKQKV